jgi:hypothetical protein
MNRLTFCVLLIASVTAEHLIVDRLTILDEENGLSVTIRKCGIETRFLLCEPDGESLTITDKMYFGELYPSSSVSEQLMLWPFVVTEPITVDARGTVLSSEPWNIEGFSFANVTVTDAENLSNGTTGNSYRLIYDCLDEIRDGGECTALILGSIQIERSGRTHEEMSLIDSLRNEGLLNEAMAWLIVVMLFAVFISACFRLYRIRSQDRYSPQIDRI